MDKQQAKKYIKEGIQHFSIAVPDSITDATKIIQDGICDGLIENGVEGNVDISYMYEQVFDYIIYEVTVKVN